MSEADRPTERERAALAALGIIGDDVAAYLRGEAVVFYLNPQQRSGIAVIQATESRLRCGIVEISDPGRGVALLARFRGRCQTLATCRGAQELELFGAAVINLKLEGLLLRQGFQRAVDAVPAGLGGGQVEILTKVFPVAPEVGG